MDSMRYFILFATRLNKKGSVTLDKIANTTKNCKFFDTPIRYQNCNKELPFSFLKLLPKHHHALVILPTRLNAGRGDEGELGAVPVNKTGIQIYVNIFF